MKQHTTKLELRHLLHHVVADSLLLPDATHSLAAEEGGGDLLRTGAESWGEGGAYLLPW